MFGQLLAKVIGTQNERDLKRLRPLVEEINALEPTIAARVLRVLEDVPLRMVSQAASRRNITVVLRESDLPHAMQRLHEEFFT